MSIVHDFSLLTQNQANKAKKISAGFSFSPAETDAILLLKTHFILFPIFFPPLLIPARVALGFGLGGVFGSIFWKLGLQESSIQNRISLFVNVAMNSAMFGCIRALQTLAIEKKVVALERMDQVSTCSRRARKERLLINPLPFRGYFPPSLTPRWRKL